MQRDRLLQQSMFLPDTNNRANNRPSVPIEYNFPLSNVRKIGTGYNSHDSHLQQQSVILPQPRKLIMNNSFDQSSQTPRPTDSSPFNDIYKKLEELGKVVDKHEEKLRSFHPQADISKHVLAQMKKNLPVFSGSNEAYDHILTQKLEIKQIQEQLAKIPKIQDIEQIIKKQMQGTGKFSQINASSNISLIGTGKSNEIDSIINDLVKKFENFQNVINNFETEVSMIKKNLSNLNMQMKVSPIVSNSCIILKYQQLFKARNKPQSDIVLSQSTYYIDNQGHLLDCHSRYIVDQKGKKIKLQQKHLALLRNQKILQ